MHSQRFWVIKHHKGLTEGDSWINKREQQTENCIWKTEDKWFYTTARQINNCKIPKPFLGYNTLKSWQKIKEILRFNALLVII